MSILLKHSLFILSTILCWLVTLCYASYADAEEPQRFPQIHSFKVQEGDSESWSQMNLLDDDWLSLKAGQIDPQYKLIWVRANFDLPEGFSKTKSPLGLYVFGAMASEIWLNGDFIGRNGQPANSKEEEKAGMMYAVLYIPPEKLLTTGNQLAIRMSSFHLRKPLASPIHCICFDEFKDPRAPFLLYYSPTIVTSSALLLGAVYFSWLFFFNTKDKSNLALALMSVFFLAQMGAEISRGFISYIYPQHILRLDLIQLFAMLSGLTLVWHLSERYCKKLVWPILGLVLFFMVVTYFVENSYDGKTLYTILSALAVAFVISAIFAVKKEPGAIYVATLLVLIWVLFFYNPSNFLDLSYYLGATALLFVLFIQQAISLRTSQVKTSQALLRASRMELELLKRQIQPHFLLNTLTALSELIESAPAKGVKMIEALADEFRLLLSVSDQSLISLEREIALCRCHLQVMSYRKGQLFALLVEGEVGQRRIPPGVLHTQIENALSHNTYVGQVEFVLTIESLEEHNYRLTLRSPLGGDGNQSKNLGLGHQFIKARMQEAFADDWEFTSRPDRDNHWLDTLVIMRPS